MAFESHPDANLLAAYCEGGLTAHARQQVLRHLADCPACRSVASGASAAYQLVFTPPTSRRPARPAWASLAAACLALAAAGLWLRPSQPAPPRPATLLRLASVTPARTPAPPIPARARRRRAPVPPALNVLAVATDSVPALLPEPSPTGAEFRPSIDFSPLMTGFLDQPPLRTPRGQLSAELASWTGSAPQPSPIPPASSLALSTPATVATSAAVWPYANGFSTGSAQLPPSGPMAPSIASGLGWAISRGGQVLRSIGAGVWASVPLVPGVHFRALFNSNATIWAGGLANQLFVSADRGAHWRQVRLPGLGSNPPPLRSISFSDPQHGLVAAADGSAWITADAGLSWSKQ